MQPAIPIDKLVFDQTFYTNSETINPIRLLCWANIKNFNIKSFTIRLPQRTSAKYITVKFIQSTRERVPSYDARELNTDLTKIVVNGRMYKI